MSARRRLSPRARFLTEEARELVAVLAVFLVLGAVAVLALSH